MSGRQRGYAAVYDGHIFLDTVGLHERTAMVNWLFIHAGFNVPLGMGDFAIRDHFAKLAAPMSVTVKPVSIEMEI
ncbi:hypothetical protein [Mesorhizobium sp.]|uniref:hypothetical protein n=1 Tax=Mesorhizobium sp. TaxID=1871066 RepID=UPI0011FFBECC|nr:hypothetical protein [Mesorhizobium sp.]TIX28880.1 MAG: hypothetical protein E5V35_00530 [Mesorhizobium sp.]